MMIKANIAGVVPYQLNNSRIAREEQSVWGGDKYYA